jgi:transcriptional regulator with XRE-family HTH domain
VISVRQIKAARALLGWSATELAERCGIGSATVKRYELQDGYPKATVQNLAAIQAVFEDSGVEFLGDPLVNPGVMLHLK